MSSPYEDLEDMAQHRFAECENSDNDRESTQAEIVEVLLLQAIRIQAKYLDTQAVLS